MTSNGQAVLLNLAVLIIALGLLVLSTRKLFSKGGGLTNILWLILLLFASGTFSGSVQRLLGTKVNFLDVPEVIVTILRGLGVGLKGFLASFGA
jgi:hypothetical protein